MHPAIALRQEVKTLTAELEAKQAALQRKQDELKMAESRCHHIWGATKADHIYHEGYTIPGDPPGTMGVDWRGPTHVAPRTEKRWVRQCKICEKTEVTTHTTQVSHEEPKFS